MSAMIDFHTHILPAVDDGSDSVKTSIRMLSEEAAQGIDKVVLTPHFYANHDSPERFLERRNKAFGLLLDSLNEVEGVPKLYLGAEIHFFEGVSDCEFLSDMSIDMLYKNSRMVMIEMPMRKWSDRVLHEIDGIWHKQKLVPVIAHIDRYIEAMGMKNIPDELFQLPVVIQANSSFFIKRSSRKTAINMLRQGKINVLGSDCHDLDERKPNLLEAIRIIERYIGESGLEYISSQINAV